MEKESMDERWKNARVNDWNEREKKGILCIYVWSFYCWMYLTFVVDYKICIFKILIYFSSEKIKIVVFYIFVPFYLHVFWNKINGLSRESIWYLNTWTTLNILRFFVSLEGTTTFSVSYRIKLYSTIHNTLKKKMKCLFKWYKI